MMVHGSAIFPFAEVEAVEAEAEAAEAETAEAAVFCFAARTSNRGSNPPEEAEEL
jgi:hypothetical protein